MAKRLTKAQQAVAHEKALMAALKWPDRPCPAPWSEAELRAMVEDVPSPRSARGWTYNAYSKRVTRGCFRMASHASEGDKTTSQGVGGPWFATEADAWLAMQWRVCRRFAEELLALSETAPLPAPLERGEGK